MPALPRTAHVTHGKQDGSWTAGKASASRSRIAFVEPPKGLTTCSNLLIGPGRFNRDLESVERCADLERLVATPAQITGP